MVRPARARAGFLRVYHQPALRIGADALPLFASLTLRKLAQGPEAFDSFVHSAESPLIIFGELLVIFGGLYHGLNGVRIALNSFGIGVPYQRQLFYGVFILTVIASVIFAVRMFTA